MRIKQVIKSPEKVLVELSLTLLVVILTNSCASDNIEELYGLPDFVCDPQQVGFSTVIQPIIQTNCAIKGCHVPGTGRANFEDANQIKFNAVEMKQRTQSLDMPRGGGSLSQKEIDQISCWVDSGADISN